jgi:hypothetical protein
MRSLPACRRRFPRRCTTPPLTPSGRPIRVPPTTERNSRTAPPRSEIALQPAEQGAERGGVGVERGAALASECDRGERSSAVAGRFAGQVARVFELAQVGDNVAGGKLEHVL